MDMWDTLGKCVAVALATLLLASIPEMLLLGSNKASQLVKLKDTMPGMTHCVSDEHYHSIRRKLLPIAELPSILRVIVIVIVI